MGHCVPIYLMNSGTRNFFGTTIFETKYISAARTLYKSTLSMALILASNATILSMSSDDLVLWDLLANASEVSASDYTDGGLCRGS